VGANSKYDMRRLEIEGIKLNGPIYDCLLMARIEYNRHMSYSLDACLKRIGLEKDDKVSLYIKDHKCFHSETVPGKKVKEKYLHFEMVPYDIILPYSMLDVTNLLKLYEYQLAYFNLPENKEQMRLVHSNMELVKTVYDMESRGICIDVDYCKEMYAKSTGVVAELVKELEDIVGYPYKAGPIWLLKALTEQGVVINFSNKTAGMSKDTPDFDSEALEAMDNAVASLVVRIRETEKEGTFYATLLRFQVDGVIHTNYRLNGTDTLRFSSSDPNLQNIPSCKKDEMNTVRHAFKPRPGFKFVSIDYSAMEFRLCVDFAGEHWMIEAIKKGLDPHELVAENMGASRKAAKTLQFLTMYGGGAQKLADTLGCDLAKAKQLKNDYFRALPAVSKLHRTVQDTAVSRGFLRSVYGMRYFLNDPNFAYKVLNHLIQGTGALIIREAMNKIAYILEGTKSKMTLQVHDELLFEIADDEMDLIPMIKKIMEDEWKPINGMNMVCDVAISDVSWNENTFYKWESNNAR
jgi:DNA polymerase-1